MDNTFFPLRAEAATPPIPQPVLDFVGKVSQEILNPIIVIMFALATVYFFWGIALYIWNPENEQVREDGKRRMFWGVIGMFIMVSVFGIMRLIISSIGGDQGLMNYV